jgi:arginine deiminase
METHALAEWHNLRDVMIHRPGIEMFFGLLEPYSFLYERAFSMDGAVHEHANLEHTLASHNVNVHRLKHSMVRTSRENELLMELARKYALKIVKFRGPTKESREAARAFKENVSSLDPETLYNILVLRPTISLKKGRGARVIFPHVTLNVPLANLYFMRDQQALTDRGIVVGRMAKPQRRLEPFLTSTVLQAMGAEMAYQVQPPGTFEGGDFIPAGDFAMIGIGDRTNRSAVDQIMRHGLGFEEIVVVHQATHPLMEQRDPMINMHLDTYLNIAGEGIAVGCLPLLSRATIEVYRRRTSSSSLMDVRYEKTSSGSNIQEYLTRKGYKFIPITTFEQMCYASNFLCLRDREIIAIEVEEVAQRVLKNLEVMKSHYPKRYSRLYAHVKKEYAELRANGRFFPHKSEFYELGVKIIPILLEEITGGYGGAHCMTCALNREPTK